VTVILDTNALMMPVECDVRLFDELDRLGFDGDYVIPAAVLAELERLADGGGREAVAASVGRDLAERCRVVETAASFADDAVVELAVGAVGDGADESATGEADESATGEADESATGEADGGAATGAVDDATDGADDDAAAGHGGSGDGTGIEGERVVVTNDRPLRDRLLARGVRVIGIRGRNKLDVTQP
jgi:hypothetical protein